LGKKQDPHLQNNQSKIDRRGSSGRAPASQEQNPEFKPQYRKIIKIIKPFRNAQRRTDTIDKKIFI
jgi:hypothetical protein